MSDAYEIVTYQGRKMDKMSVAAFEHWQDILGESLSITQGSYNAGGVSASAGTHDGGGVIDIKIPTGATWQATVLAGRYAGWCAWYRSEAEGPWPAHIHAVLRGNDKLSSGAARQVEDYKKGLNGLANHNEDTQPRPVGAVLDFLYPLSLVEWRHFDVERRTRAKIPAPQVRRVQRALNARHGQDLAVDGEWGRLTERAFDSWTDALAEGVGERRAMRLLGGGRFHLVLRGDE